MHRRDCLTVLCAGLLPGVPVNASTSVKSRFRAAICAYSFRNLLKDKQLSYAGVIRLAADVNADGVDLTTYWLPDTTDQTLFPLKRLAYRSGVAIYTIGIRARLVQPTKELQLAEAQTVGKWVEAAEKLGASHIRIFGGAVPKGATEDQAVGWAVETAARCAEVAGNRGITLGVEDDGGVTTNADRTIEIVRKTASPWLGINLDVGNFPDDAYAQIEACASYATNVHFKPNVHMHRQSEPADWPRILRILGKAGYRGYLALEYESTDDPLTAVPELIAKMRAAIAAHAG